jgi:integrase
VSKITNHALSDVLNVIEKADIPDPRRRELLAAVRRICRMAGRSASTINADPETVRDILKDIQPAAHGITKKTWANLRSLLAAALEMAGIIDHVDRGNALRDPHWGPLLHTIAHDKRLANGIAAFANWCAKNGILSEQVTDDTVQQFLTWLVTRTIRARPRDIAQTVPIVWNEAADHITNWPKVLLSRLSFRPPTKHLQWEELNEGFRRDAEAYLTLRKTPDIFDTSANAPRRPLAATTLRLQRQHIRLAASVMIESGASKDDITCLASLVDPERFKIVLRYYHQQASGEPNAFAGGIATTLIQVARYYAALGSAEIDELKRIAARLPPVPFDLRPKNKALLRKLESDRLRASLVFLPDRVITRAKKDPERLLRRFVDIQVAIAVAIALVTPLRPENLSRLNWQRHFGEPDGPKGQLLLHIPAEETKTRKRELIFELPGDVAKTIRWYRRTVLPVLGADETGDLFVTRKGRPKSQATLSEQIAERITREVGVRISPHKFRHIAAAWYLESHPEDFETVRALLGHGWSKTTLIYAGNSSRRAGRAFASHIVEQREELKLKQRPRKKRRGRS